MTSADCIDSLHRAMCSTFNTDYLTEATEVETLVKPDVDENKKCIKRIDKANSMHINDYIITASCAKKQELKKPLKSEESPPAHNEPSLELLLSSMSNTFDAECATCTDEADSLLNHDLAEDKTMKWRNLFNNKFAYKENITHKRGIRVKKQCNSLQQSLSYITSNGKASHANKKQKKEVQLSKKSEKKLDGRRFSYRKVDRKSAKALAESEHYREVTTSTAACMERHIKDLLSDDEDYQQHNETKKNNFTATEAQLTVFKEELNVGDDDNEANALPACRNQSWNNYENSNGLLDVNLNYPQYENRTKEQWTKTQLLKLETIKHDIDDIYDNLEGVDVKYNKNELAEKDNSDLGKGKVSRTRKIKSTWTEVDNTKAKNCFADKNNGKKKIRK